MGKVIKIIDKRTIMIDIVGKMGDEVIIFEKGPMIKDLEGNDLEHLELIKGKATIIQIQNRFSIAKSSPKYEIKDRSLLELSLPYFKSKHIVDNNFLTSEGNITDSDIKLTPQKKEVMLGDSVRVISISK